MHNISTHRLRFSVRFSLSLLCCIRIIFLFNWYRNLNVFSPSFCQQNHSKLCRGEGNSKKKVFFTSRKLPFYLFPSPRSQSFRAVFFWIIMTIFSFFRSEDFCILFAEQNLFIFYKLFHFLFFGLRVGKIAFRVLPLHDSRSVTRRLEQVWV